MIGVSCPLASSLKVLSPMSPSARHGEACRTHRRGAVHRGDPAVTCRPLGVAMLQYTQLAVSPRAVSLMSMSCRTTSPFPLDVRAARVRLTRTSLAPCTFEADQPVIGPSSPRPAAPRPRVREQVPPAVRRHAYPRGLPRQRTDPRYCRMTSIPLPRRRAVPLRATSVTP